MSFLLLISCNKKEDQIIEPCTSGNWGSVTVDNEKICFENIRYTERYKNTNKAEAQLILQTGLLENGVTIDAYFSLPEEGIELNKPYPAYKGTYYGAEDIVSGTLTFLHYTTTSIGDESYFHAVFELKSQNPRNPSASTDILNGEFYYR